MQGFWEGLNHFNVLYTTLLVIASNVAVAFTLRKLQRADIRETAEDWQSIANAREAWNRELERRMEAVEKNNESLNVKIAEHETNKTMLVEINLRLEREKAAMANWCGQMENELKRAGIPIPPRE